MADEKIIFSMVGVSKTFTNQKKVLNNIYLSFFYGAKIGIIGLNGSGKSTLMKIIAGIDKNLRSVTIHKRLCHVIVDEGSIGFTLTDSFHHFLPGTAHQLFCAGCHCICN